MIAKREVWNYADRVGIWTGKYKNSHNLLHWHYDCELMYVERGCVEVFCERKKHTLTRGTSFFIDSGQVHHMQALEKDSVVLVVVFDFRLLQPFFSDIQLCEPRLTGAYDVPALYRALRSVLTEKRPFYGAEAHCLLTRFLVGVFRGEALTRRVRTDKAADALKRLLEDVNEHYSDYAFEDAVHFMSMSDAYFSRYFRAATGITFSQYLNFVRTDAAVRMLHSGEDLPVTEIARRCGFTTIRNFNRIFKEITGYAPSGLPRDYSLEDKLSFSSDKAFSPTLFDCELLESAAA